MLVLLTKWRKAAAFTRLKVVANHAIIFAGFMLLLMQLHGYLHSVNPDEFGFNKDAHHHIHIDMQAEKQKHFKHDSL